MARQVARGDGRVEQRRPSLRRRDAAVERDAGVYRRGRVRRLGSPQEPAAPGNPAPARGFFLPYVASDTAAAAAGIAETADARFSLPSMGSRAADARQRFGC
jgi:hypothetical protein